MFSKRYKKILAVLLAAMFTFNSAPMPDVSATEIPPIVDEISSEVPGETTVEDAASQEIPEVEESASQEVPKTEEAASQETPKTDEAASLEITKVEKTPSQELPEVDESGIAHDVWVNPLYEDLMTDELYQELLNAQPAAQAILDDGSSYYLAGATGNVQVCGEYMRGQMKKRVNGFSVTVSYDSKKYPTYKEVVQALMDVAYEHDGSAPDEGDYLRYHVYKTRYSYVPGANPMTITFENMTYWTTDAQEQSTTTAVNNLLNRLNLDGKTEYEKTKAIYEWVTNNIGYNYDAAKDGPTKIIDDDTGEEVFCNYTAWSAYGGIVDKTCVCQGYANLLYRLLRTEGVDCRIIAGLGNGGDHAWNIVRIGDLYYNADSTWDEGVTGYSGVGRKDYFLKNNTDFRNHFRDDEYLSAAFSAKYPMSAKSINTSTGLPKTDGTTDETQSSVSLVNNANIQETFTTIDGKTVSTAANGKSKIIVFGTNHSSSTDLLKGLDKAGVTTNADVVFVGITAPAIPFTASLSAIKSAKETVGSSNITYCYDTSNASFEAMRSYMGKSGHNSFSYPPTLVVIDSNNKIRYGQDSKSINVEYIETALKEIAPATLATPTGVSASVSATGNVTVSWNLVSGADSYAIYRKYQNSSFSKIATVKNVNTFVDSIAQTGFGRYEYKVQAQKGYSAKSELSQLAYVIFNGADTIQYVLNGGVNHSDNPSSYIAGNAVQLKAPTRAGYDFVGWYTDAACSTPASNPAVAETDEGTKTFYAKWKAKSIKITYSQSVNPDDQAQYGQPISTDEPSINKNSATVNYDSNIVDLATASLKGSDFLGWYTKEGVQVKENDKCLFVEDTVLYPRWKAKKYKISFQAISGGELIPFEDKEVTYGEAVGTLPTPETRDENLFKAWRKVSDQSKVDANTVYTDDEDIILEAQWTEKPVNVKMLSIEGREVLNKGQNLSSEDCPDSIGGFKNLAEAMAAIESIGDKNEIYVVEINNERDVVGIAAGSGFTMPKNAAGLIFVGKHKEDVQTDSLVYPVAFTANMPVTFVDIDFVCKKSVTVNSLLTLYNSNITAAESMTVKDVRVAGVVMDGDNPTAANYVNSLNCATTGKNKYTQSGINEVVENSGAKLYVNGTEQTVYDVGVGATYVKLYTNNNSNKNLIAVYQTVQDAFAKIESLKNKNNEYVVELYGSGADATFDGATINLNFPVNCASLTIANPESEMAYTKTLVLKKDLTVKSNLYLENITIETIALGNVSIGNYTLGLNNVIVSGAGIQNITGGGENGSSKLILDNNNKLAIAGGATKIGTLVMKKNEGCPVQTLATKGNISVGTIELESNSRIVGLATVTKKNDKITKVTSGVSITKEIVSLDGAKLDIELIQKLSNTSYIGIDEASLDPALFSTGINVCKAPVAAIQNIYTDMAGDLNYKKAGGLVYAGRFTNGFVLEYDDGNTIVNTGFETWAEAVKEINTLKTARDYTIRVLEQGQNISLNKAAALTMPAKANVGTLTIDGVYASEGYTLFYTGNLAFADSKTVLKDITLEQAVKVGSTYVPASDPRNPAYPAVVQVNLSGNTLEIAGNTRFVNPIKINGGGNSSEIILDAASSLKGFSEDYHYSNVYWSAIDDDESALYAALEQAPTHVIFGEITNLGRLDIAPGQVLAVYEAIALKSGVKTPTKVTFTVNNMDIAGGLLIGKELSNNIATINNLNLAPSAMMIVKGTVNAKNFDPSFGASYALVGATADVFEVVDADTMEMQWVGQYLTLTEAVTAINNKKNNNGNYIISLHKNVNASNWNFTMPSAAAQITFVTDERVSKCTIDGGAKTIALKQDTIFDGVDVYANSLTSGAKHTLYLNSSNVEVKGAVNLGAVAALDDNCLFTGTVKIAATVKNGVRTVTSVTPNIKFVNGVTSEAALKIRLKAANTFEIVDLATIYADSSAALKTNGIQFISTSNAAAKWDEVVSLVDVTNTSVKFWNKNTVCYLPADGNTIITVKKNDEVIAVVPGIVAATALIEGIKDKTAEYTLVFSQSLKFAGLKSFNMPVNAKKIVLEGVGREVYVDNDELTLNIKTDLEFKNLYVYLNKIAGTGTSGKTNLTFNDTYAEVIDCTNVSNLVLRNGSTLEFFGKIAVGTVSIEDASSSVLDNGEVYYSKGMTNAINITNDKGLNLGVKNYSEAVKFINNANDMTAEYLITVPAGYFDTSSVITFPTKAKSVLITVEGVGINEHADVKAKEIKLPSKVMAGFKKCYVDTLNISGSGAYLYLDDAVVESQKAMTFDRVYVNKLGLIDTVYAMKIGDIIGASSDPDDILFINTSRTKGNSFAATKNQLNITGTISSAELAIDCYLNKTNGSIEHIELSDYTTDYSKFSDAYAIGNMPKVDPNKVQIITSDDVVAYTFAKKAGKLYLSNKIALPVKIQGYETAEDMQSGDADKAVYVGDCENVAQASAEIDSIANNKLYWRIELAANIGSESKPVAANLVSFPQKVAGIYLCSNSEDARTIYSYNANYTFKSSVELNNVCFKSYNNKNVSINPNISGAAAYSLKINTNKNIYDRSNMNFASIVSATDLMNIKNFGNVDIITNRGGVNQVALNSISGVNNINAAGDAGQLYVLLKTASVVKNVLALDNTKLKLLAKLDVNNEAILNDSEILRGGSASNDVNFKKNLTLNNSSVAAGNITVSQKTVLNASYDGRVALAAGTAKVGDGKINLNNVSVINNSENIISITGKQDGKGNSLINVNGLVTGKNDKAVASSVTDRITVILNTSANTRLTVYNGVGIMNLKNAKADSGFFVTNASTGKLVKDKTVLRYKR